MEVNNKPNYVRSSRRQEVKTDYFTFIALISFLVFTSFIILSSTPFTSQSVLIFSSDDLLVIPWDENNEKHWHAKNKLEEIGFDPYTVPDEFDWSKHGIITPIKDQGDYGSCWTFGASATLESAWALAGNDLIRMSVQQLLDCVEPQQKGDEEVYCLNGDCKYLDADRPWSGGDAEDAFRYWHDNGFVKAADYTYIHAICKMRQMLVGSGKEPTVENLKANCEAHDSCYWNQTAWEITTSDMFWVHKAPQPCKNVNTDDSPRQGQQCKKEDATNKAIGKVKGYYEVTNYASGVGGLDEERIRKAVYLHGPLDIAMNAIPFLHYTGGIIAYSEERCDRSPDSLDHNLQLVGWGTEDGVDYWKVRNSWGAFFGENGYVRFKRHENICGIAQQTYGLLLDL